jgi:hypothetical protein
MVSLPIGSEIAANLFSQSIVAARARQLPIGELFDRAEKLKVLAQRGLVVELYKAWIAYNSDSHALYAAYFNYAVDSTPLLTGQAQSTPCANASDSSAISIRPISILGVRSKTVARPARR